MHGKTSPIVIGAIFYVITLFFYLNCSVCYGENFGGLDGYDPGSDPELTSGPPKKGDISARRSEEKTLEEKLGLTSGPAKSLEEQGIYDGGSTEDDGEQTRKTVKRLVDTGVKKGKEGVRHKEDRGTSPHETLMSGKRRPPGALPPAATSTSRPPQPNTTTKPQTGSTFPGSVAGVPEGWVSKVPAERLLSPPSIVEKPFGDRWIGEGPAAQVPKTPQTSSTSTRPPMPSEPKTLPWGQQQQQPTTSPIANASGNSSPSSISPHYKNPHRYLETQATEHLSASNPYSPSQQLKTSVARHLTSTPTRRPDWKTGATEHLSASNPYSPSQQLETAVARHLTSTPTSFTQRPDPANFSPSSAPQQQKKISWGSFRDPFVHPSSHFRDGTPSALPLPPQYLNVDAINNGEAYVTDEYSGYTDYKDPRTGKKVFFTSELTYTTGEKVISYIMGEDYNHRKNVQIEVVTVPGSGEVEVYDTGVKSNH